LLTATPSIPLGTGPVRLLLTLEGGFELEIPVTPGATGEFFQALRSVRPNE
jgi:hypothetical protein